LAAPELAPSPKFQIQLVTLPVERSANCTASGATPFWAETPKSATGVGSSTVIIPGCGSSSIPPGPATVRSTS
jgi:hypothetical protein